MNPSALLAQFHARSPREQVMLLTAGLTLLVFVVYLFAFQPFMTALTDTRARVDGNVRSIEYMREAAGEAIALQGAGGASGSPADTRTSPLAALDQTFRSMGLEQPTRIEPVGQGGARVQFSNVDVNALIRALGAVEQRFGLRVSQLNLTRRQPGLVSARVSVER
ncbi:MAG: type II secretion system protein M [Pseudomonadota bacterium]